MDQRSGQKRAVEFLYPPIDPFDQRIIDMRDGHRIYVEQCGRRDGVPVLVLHGAMGFGTADTAHLLAECLKIAFADRAAASGDPAFVKVPVEWVSVK